MIALLCLLGAAILEAAGDAVVRTGLKGQHGATGVKGVLVVVVGGLLLVAYGCLVNAPRWDFGRLLGVYVCLFFLVAQVINQVAFHQKPSLPILVGGAFIVCGGLLITFWRA